MFDFGFSEMAIIGVVALVVLGPERLPVVAKTAGQWIGKAQRFVAQVKADIDRETELSELKKLQNEAQSLANEVKTGVDAATTDFRNHMNEASAAFENTHKSLTSSAPDFNHALSLDDKDTSSQSESATESTTSTTASKPYAWPGDEDAMPSSTRTVQTWREPKTFTKRYHTGPSVDELAAEITRLRRELGLKETKMGGTIGAKRDWAPGSRTNRPRIYR